MPFTVTSFQAGEIAQAGKFNKLIQNFEAICEANSGTPAFTTSAYTNSLMTERALSNVAYRNNLALDLLEM